VDEWETFRRIERQNTFLKLATFLKIVGAATLITMAFSVAINKMQ